MLSLLMSVLWCTPEFPELSFHCLDVHHAHLVCSLLFQSISMRLTPAARQAIPVLALFALLETHSCCHQMHTL